MTLSFLNDETEAKREVTSLARGLRAKGAGVRRQASDCGLSSPSLLEMTSSLGRARLQRYRRSQDRRDELGKSHSDLEASSYKDEHIY